MTRAPIAIVGSGCVLPGANDVAAFWRRTLAGASVLAPLSLDDDRFSAFLQQPQGIPFQKMPVGRIAGYAFDWRRFKMPPKDAERINPLQLMILDAGAQALAGVAHLPKERTGLFLGATGLGWQADSGLRIRLGQLEAAAREAANDDDIESAIKIARAALEAQLQPVTEDNVVGASASVGLGRIATHFDLQGPHYSVDSGYASSLAALDVAVRALRDGEVDLAVSGGASEILSPLEMLAFAKMGALSSTEVTPFDAAADGTLLSEGCVIFALKRLEDAQQDGDDVMAVIKGVGGATDDGGRSVLAPDAAGQRRAMAAALSDADIDPATVGYVECHATGTPLGDATELLALAGTYVDDTAPVSLGAAKATFGHLRGGAGAVGLLKAALAAKHALWPGQPGPVSPPHGSPHVDGVGLTVPCETTPLVPRGGAAVPRIGVTAVGFGGTTFHAIVEPAPSPAVASGASRKPGRVDRHEAEEIAIVAMGGRFPGANSASALKAFLESGGDATREIPSERWDVEAFYDADKTREDTCYTKLGCFLDALPTTLDPAWRIPPSALASLDPCQVLALEAAEAALEGLRGQMANWDRQRVGVMLAFLPYQGRKFLADARVNSERYFDALREALLHLSTSPTVVEQTIERTRDAFCRDLPLLTEDSFTGWQGALCAGRISRAFGFGGPHFVTDSACASTHAALHAAVKALRHRTCDVVLSGGVWADMMPEFFVAACRFNALSATGSTPFDEAADGFVPGEGAGVFVLRRLEDAVAHHEPILAVLRSVAGSSDGKGSSVLAPTEAGEALAMRRALDLGGIASEDVGYVECHGTGTALGDVVEAKAVATAYHGRHTALPIGSVKSNIGHLNAAAGVPALMKAIWAVQDGQVPRSIKVVRANPALDLEAKTALTIATTETPILSATGKPRRVGVSGFGVGGSNMHLIVEEHLRPDVRAEALPMAATTREEANFSARTSLRPHGFEVSDGPSIGDARANLMAGQAPTNAERNCRFAVAAKDPEEKTRALRLANAPHSSRRMLAALGAFAGEPSSPSTTAAIFPGQGPHYPDMLLALATAYPDVRQTVEEADAAFEQIAGRPLSPAFWVKGAPFQQRDEDIHCATLVVNVALFRALAARGFAPDVMLGQSAGELSALVASDAIDLAEGLALMRARTAAVLSVPSSRAGTMLALPLGAAVVAPTLRQVSGYAVIAADNGPQACLVSADAEAAAAVSAWAVRQGVEATALAVSHGYHSELIADAVAPYRKALAQISFRTPSVPLISTITGAELSRFDLARLPDLLAEQLVRPVRLADAVRAAHQRGVSLFIECGPKRALSTFVESIVDEPATIAVPSLHPKTGEVAQFRRAWAALWVQGGANLEPRRAPVSGPVDSQDAEVDAAIGHLRKALNGARTRDDAALLLLRVQQELVKLTLSLDDIVGAKRKEPRVETAGAKLSPRDQVATPHRPRESAGPASIPAVMPAGVEGSVPLRKTDGDARAEARQFGPRDQDPAQQAQVERLLIAELASRTGYPDDMIDLDLDLEADLGIDTVKQIAAVAKVRDDLGLAIDENFKLRDAPTVRLVAQVLCRRLRNVQPAQASSDVSSILPPQTKTVPMRERPHASTLTSTLGPSHASNAPNERDDVRALLVSALVAKTGYPEDMLEEDLDLEADLGIDTVKQVSAFAEVREALGLVVEDGFRLRDFPTLALVAKHFQDRLAEVGPEASKVDDRPDPRQRPAASGVTTSTPSPFDETRVAVRADIVSALVARTGYPAEMLEDHLDLEADLGIDTVKQVSAFADVREGLGLTLDENFRLRDFPTLGAIVEHFCERVAGARPVTPDSVVEKKSPLERREAHLEPRPSTSVVATLPVEAAEGSTHDVVLASGDLSSVAFALLTGGGEAAKVRPGQAFGWIETSSAANAGAAVLHVTKGTSKVELRQRGVWVASADSLEPCGRQSHPPPLLPSTELSDRARRAVERHWPTGCGYLRDMRKVGGHHWRAVVEVDGQTRIALAAAIRVFELAAYVSSQALTVTERCRFLSCASLEVGQSALIDTMLRPARGGGWEGQVRLVSPVSGADGETVLEGLRGTTSAARDQDTEHWMLLSTELNHHEP